MATQILMMLFKPLLIIKSLNNYRLAFYFMFFLFHFSHAKIISFQKKIDINKMVKELESKQLRLLQEIIQIHQSLDVTYKINKVFLSDNRDKVAIIGQDMVNNVFKVRNHFCRLKLCLEFFKSDKNFDIYKKKLSKYQTFHGSKKYQLPLSMALFTDLFKDNMNWIYKLKHNGYTIIDVGRLPKDKSFSIFYTWEQIHLFN